MDGSARLRVTLLGAFQVTRGAEALPVPGARLRGLVARLALAGGRPVEQSVLVDAIWGPDLPADPAHALQALVSRLRRALGSPSDVTQVAGGYRLTVDAADVDALRFEQLATAASLDDAVTLWGDRPGVEPPVVAAVDPAAATRLARLSIEAVIDLAKAELSQGRPDSATARLTALLAEHPVHERAAAVLMDALATQGRQAEALAQYEQIRAALADDLGADPGTALRERHLNLLRAEPAKETEPATLPASLTSFVGRTDDLARIDTLLGAGRMVTVLGPGGAGKTRIALEAARRREYRDGRWLVDLSSVTEPAKVAAAALAASGLRGTALFEASAKPVDDLDVLADQLSGKETLLVVDNCEHLIDAVAHLLSALLPRCAGLRVLATSREPLAIDGEALVPLGPLPLPEPDADVEQARDTASVRLFTERAAAVRPGFTVDERNLDDVLRIVRGLDGMPLALELAAARLRTLSLADLASGLSDRFRLLATGSRTAFPRHRTLRAVIAWSWDLLSEDARTVAERISVLPGGVTPASAAAVCALPVEQARELLADLVDRSLLQLVPGRYRMLETIREYGLECLAEQGILPTVRNLSAEYFAELAAVNDPLLRGPGQLDALQSLTAEYDNVLAALRHLCDTSDAGLALALDLTWYWHMLGRHADASYWLGQVTAQPGMHHDVAAGALLLDADGPADEVVTRLLNYPELPPFGVLTAAGLAARAGIDASPLIQRLADGPDRWLAGLARITRAELAENDGHLAEVGEDVAVALDCFTEAGDSWGLAMALPMRALLRQYDGDLAGALADLTEAKRLAQEFGSLNHSDETFIDLRLIDLHVRLGETDQAAAMIAVTRDRTLRSTMPETVVLLYAREASFRLRTGDLTRAGELIEAAEAGLSAELPFGDDHGQALVSAVRAELCLELGDGPGAEAALDRAYPAAVDSKDLPIVATVAVTVAGLAELYSRYLDGAEILGAAARLRGAHDRTDLQVRTLSSRGRLALGEERFAAAYEIGWQLPAPAAVARTDPARLRRRSPGT
ncbi:AfsR/SARP family transcriptional regulator [Amycolatopsis rubida]|uniref:AfsR/SARP family transcriptional regulator n=1 Tax=Amycolatopsis rubida TaxID=112413 RepID=A0ABX0BUS7_9PSEU|nr:MULTISPECIES: BTAD domain-containing putative transcriptional regulator [Amycolatopsis]MYW94336.1 AfsR/SARP family transcriptional regulator [Amycolatopsis rubida]NEC59325.1 AfsR/SARP family transcriptional regulator [Amycolatopsis rubida]OAP24730.1 putative HTH-type transcriptional regulator [Amycolatopsis sp. M39]